MDELRPALHVIAGPNGAGKTTVTRKLLASEWGAGVVYVNPDDIAQNEFAGWNDPDSVRKAADLGARRRREALAGRRPMAFETVFSAPDKIGFLREAKAAGYFIRLYFIGTDGPEINASRVARRFIEGGHDVPIPKIVTRYYKSVANAAVVAPHVDRFYLYDNSTEGADARLVFRAADGTVTKVYGEVPAWAAAIRNALA